MRIIAAMSDSFKLRQNRSELAQFFKVSNITIYGWFDRWKMGGIADLINKPGQGRKPILSLQNPKHIKTVKRAVEKNAQSVKAVVAELVRNELESVGVLRGQSNGRIRISNFQPHGLHLRFG